jgi:hypothetical protein
MLHSLYMKNHPYTVFNLFCFFSILSVIGGVFWLFREKIGISPESEVSFLPEQSFEEMQRISFNQPAQTDTSSSVSSTFPQNSVPVLKPQDVSTSTKNEFVADEPIVLKKEIPKQINLAVPFTSQAPEKNWSQPWQDACEEAAVLMLDAYYKGYKLSAFFSRDEILKMVKWEEEINAWGRSIEIEKIQSLITFYSKKSSRIIENPTVDQIKQFVAEGNPVYVVADGKILPNPHFQHGGPVYHALIIRGYTETSFITNDPGTQFGENYVYKYTDLMNAIRDWNSGDVVHGKRVVLVIE